LAPTAAIHSCAHNALGRPKNHLDRDHGIYRERYARLYAAEQ
jgi:hypothetical protein